jgi:hypothetical protein
LSAISASPFWLSVDGADDQRVDGRRRRLAAQPGRGHRSLRDEHPLPWSAAEHVEGDEPLAAAFRLDLEECAVRQSG